MLMPKSQREICDLSANSGLLDVDCMSVISDKISPAIAIIKIINQKRDKIWS